MVAIRMIKETQQQEEACHDDCGMPPLPQVIKFPEGYTTGALPLREEYKKYSRLLSPEGYEGFHDACFWWLLSTIAARRVYADFTDKQYTSLYIVLASRTSLYAKTTTANVARKVLKAAGLGWLLGADRTTPEKLMSDMAGWVEKDYFQQSFEEQEEIKMKTAMAGQIGWINDEFGKFVRGMLKQSSTMASYAELFLTFDDCILDKYRNATISRSSEPITAPYLAMLGNMTFSNVRDSAKRASEFWSDGFWARFIFISPPPGTYKDEPFGLGQKPVPGLLLRDLRNWHDRLGSPRIDIEMNTDEKGKSSGFTVVELEPHKETSITVSQLAYEAWKRYRSALKAMIADMPNEDLDGSYDRLPNKAMRVATLTASLLGKSEITLEHWALAQEVAESWRYSLHQFYTQVNTADEHQETMDDKILAAMRHLAKNGNTAPSARDIAKRLHKDSRDIKPHLIILARDGTIQEVQGRQSPKYSLIDEV